MLPAKKFKNRGFTLIETLIALLVLGIFFVAVALILQMILNLVGEGRVRTVATALGTEKIELVHNLPFNDVGTVGGIPSGVLTQQETVTVNGSEFAVETQVVYVDDPFDGLAPDDTVNIDYKRVRISISWGGAFASKNPLVFVSDIAPKGLETTLGGGTLSILVFNAIGELVQDASVHIENTSVEPNIDINTSTDAQGRVHLPGAPICTECYKVTVTKDGYSTSRTYGAEEVTNPLKPHMTILEGEVSEVSFSIDQLSAISVYVTGSRENGYPPFSGVQFTLRGAKTIGTDSEDSPVYKYEETHVSGAGGQLAINDLEWDLYDVGIPIGSSVDFAGSTPIVPFSLSPNEALTLRIVTTAATDNSLLTIITDSSDSPLASASVVLSLDPFESTKSTALSDKPDFGQVFFSNLSTSIYSLTVSLSGYIEASSSVSISGDTKETIVLSTE